MEQTSASIAVVAGYQVLKLPKRLPITKGQFVGFYSSAAGLINVLNSTEGELPDGMSTTPNPPVGTSIAGFTNLTVKHAIRITSDPSSSVVLSNVYTTTGNKTVLVR